MPNQLPRPRSVLLVLVSLSLIYLAVVMSGRSRDRAETESLTQAKDEQRHARLCQGLAEKYDPQSEALVPELGAVIGPNNLPLDRRALYASVALSCVTESLSVAPLLRMRQLVVDLFSPCSMPRFLPTESTCNPRRQVPRVLLPMESCLSPWRSRFAKRRFARSSSPACDALA